MSKSRSLLSVSRKPDELKSLVGDHAAHWSEQELQLKRQLQEGNMEGIFDGFEKMMMKRGGIENDKLEQVITDETPLPAPIDIEEESKKDTEQEERPVKMAIKRKKRRGEKKVDAQNDKLQKVMPDETPLTALNDEEENMEMWEEEKMSLIKQLRDKAERENDKLQKVMPDETPLAALNDEEENMAKRIEEKKVDAQEIKLEKVITDETPIAALNERRTKEIPVKEKRRKKIENRKRLYRKRWLGAARNGDEAKSSSLEKDELGKLL